MKEELVRKKRPTVLDDAVDKVYWYLLKKYGAEKYLTTHLACKELRLRGRELNSILYGNKLPTLDKRGIATYIVLHT